jgi:DNA-directed RNA polymerase specialized sigma24 family protein
VTEPSSEPALLEAARRDDGAASARLVEPYRAELHALCYRMLGSVQDAEDALQDALLGAWRGLAGFEGRSSLRAWLYRITTNACLRLLRRRPRRLLSADYGPPSTRSTTSASRWPSRSGWSRTRRPRAATSCASASSWPSWPPWAPTAGGSW